MAERGAYHTDDAATTNRARRLLTAFILTPRELSCALDISTMHASTVLKRLWERGECQRWPYEAKSYRYARFP